MPFRRRRTDIPQDDPDRWLLTYADLITLLLAFFIVLYSISRINAEKFESVSQALRGVLKGGTSILRQELPHNLNTGHGALQTGDLNMLQTLVHEQALEIGQQDEIITDLSERGLTIHIMESALFDEGRANLKQRARSILDVVAEDIIRMPNHVRVEGHTDDRPIKNDFYPSNWELSTARATNVVRYLINTHGYPPTKISALGYAAYRPLLPNNSIENRARNRRVDIVVLTNELSAVEPATGLNTYVDQQLRFIDGIQKENISLPEGNNFPF